LGVVRHALYICSVNYCRTCYRVTQSSKMSRRGMIDNVTTTVLYVYINRPRYAERHHREARKVYRYLTKKKKKK